MRNENGYAKIDAKAEKKEKGREQRSYDEGHFGKRISQKEGAAVTGMPGICLYAK